MKNKGIRVKEKVRKNTQRGKIRTVNSLRKKMCTNIEGWAENENRSRGEQVASQEEKGEKLEKEEKISRKIESSQIKRQ